MSTRFAWAAALCCMLLILYGCATPAKQGVFRGSWYLQRDTTSNSKPQLYVAILNADTHPQTVVKLVVNGLDEGSQGAYELKDKTPFLLLPGGLLVRSMSEFSQIGKDGATWPNCLLPVRFTAVLTNGSESGEMVQMPSALPAEWEKCPQP